MKAIKEQTDNNFNTSSAKKAIEFLTDIGEVRRITNRKWKKSVGGFPFYDKDLTVEQLIKTIKKIGITHFSRTWCGDGWSIGGQFKCAKTINHSFGIYQ
jgi:hypothetical protein